MITLIIAIIKILIFILVIIIIIIIIIIIMITRIIAIIIIFIFILVIIIIIIMIIIIIIIIIIKRNLYSAFYHKSSKALNNARLKYNKNKTTSNIKILFKKVGFQPFFKNWNGRTKFN